MNDGFPEFSSKATIALQQLISDDDTIMLTTSHKTNFSIEEWKSIFYNRGIKVDKVRCLPENVNHLNRKDEILNWFKANQVDKKFIIIDDDASLNELPDYLKAHLVMPSPYIGLTEEYLVKFEALR